MDSTVQIALLLSLFAGLSTAIGGSVVFFKSLKTDGFLAFSLSFAAGVMLYVSFAEMIPHSFETLGEELGDTKGNLVGTALLFAGMLVVYLIDKFIPALEHNKTPKEPSEIPYKKDKKSLFRTGVLVATAVAIHNFPEGIATFTSSMNELSTGMLITFAIAIHNIPEGVAVATPIYHATGNKWKAFWFSVLSGIAEPIGALLTYLLLGNLIGDLFFGYIMAIIAGIMIFISFDYLIPTSLNFGKKKYFINGIVVGMLVMAVSLIFE